MSAVGLSPAGSFIATEERVNARVLARRLFYLLYEQRERGGLPILGDDSRLLSACYQFVGEVWQGEGGHHA